MKEQWDSGFGTHDWDLIVLDEFLGQRSVTYMNELCEGGHMWMSQKGEQPVLKTKNIPVIVLSNHSLEEIYSKVAKETPVLFKALLSRFEIVYVGETVHTINIKMKSSSFDEECNTKKTNKRKRN